MTHQTVSTAFDKAKVLFRRHGGLLRTSEAIRLGIHPRTLYAMRDEGVLEQLSIGLYRLAELPPLGAPDFVTVAVISSWSCRPKRASIISVIPKSLITEATIPKWSKRSTLTDSIDNPPDCIALTR